LVKNKDGEIETKSTELKGTKGEQFLGLMKVLADSFVVAISSGLSVIEEKLKFLAEIFATYFAAALEVKIDLFKSIFSKLGAAMAIGLIDAIKSQVMPLLSKVSGAINKNPVGGITAQRVKSTLDNPVVKTAVKGMGQVSGLLDVGMGLMSMLEISNAFKNIQKNTEDSAKAFYSGMKENAETSTRVKNIATSANRNAHQEKTKLR
jgi:hypothetical protein